MERMPFRSGPDKPTPPPVEFSAQQQRDLADAFYEAELAVLKALTRAAGDSDTRTSARTTASLTHALATLRFAAGQTRGGLPFLPGPPDFDDP